ncbi:MAG: sensor histidine kinase [Chitinophagales bacterium]
MNNLLYALFGFEKNKSKTYTFLIVLIHVCTWCLFFLLPFFFYPVKFADKTIFFREVISKIFLVGVFYFNYYVLLPRFFERKKYLIYFLLVLSLIILALVQDIIVREKIIRARPFVIRMSEAPQRMSQDTSVADSFIPFNDSITSPTPRFPLFETKILGVPRGIFFMSLNKVISFSLIVLLIGGLIRLGFSFIKNQNEKKVLENATLNAEINFLRSQINPHFLFNTLNGIYALAHEGSGQTKDAILKLSDLLRYVLYDSSDEKVPLSKDIQYITNYIDLQRLRLSSKVLIDYRIEGNIQNHSISPLLLIAFIENAFKHGISYSHSSAIRIHIKVFEKTLTLYVENPVVENNSFAGGLGLKNVKRRLELIYPGHHSLDIFQKNQLNIVNLKIDLK